MSPAHDFIFANADFDEALFMPMELADPDPTLEELLAFEVM